MEREWNGTGDESANVEGSDTIDNDPLIEVKAKNRTKKVFIQTSRVYRISTTSSDLVPQRSSSKTGVRQGGLQLKW